jgi:hypothetical protein
MRPMSAHNAAITERILDLLDQEAPLPISTSAILKRLGLRGLNATALQLLNRLARRGEVEKFPPCEPGGCCYWRRLGGSAPAAPRGEASGRGAGWRRLRRYADRRTGVPWIRVTVRVSGKRQIELFEAMCAATGRRPHELAGDVLLAELWEAGPDPALAREARVARKWRIRRARGRD